MNAFDARSTVIDPKRVTRFWLENVSAVYEPQNLSVSGLEEEISLFERSRTLRSAFEEKRFDPFEPVIRLVKEAGALVTSISLICKHFSERFRIHRAQQQQASKSLNMNSKRQYLLHFH